MRISNHFTTVLFLIICGLFLVSGTSGDVNQYDIVYLSDEDVYVDSSDQIEVLLQINTIVVECFAECDDTVLITQDEGTGYSWSLDGSLLTIYRSGSYAFSDTMFSEFGIYIAAPFVTLDGRKWFDVNTPTDEQVVITGYKYPKGKSIIGIHGNAKDLKSLNLSFVSVSISHANERVIGVTGARNILDSSIELSGKKKALIVGIKELYGTFDRSDISIFGADKATLIGIQSLYGKVTGGSIIIDVPILCEQFEMVGIFELTKKAEISGGTVKLTGIGYGYVNGIHVLRGIVTGGAFELLSNEAYGIEKVVGGVVSGGTFDIQGVSLAGGIWSVSHGLIDGGLFSLSGDDVIGIYQLAEGGRVSDGTFTLIGENGIGIYSLSDHARVENAEFKIYGSKQAVAIFMVEGNAEIEGGSFRTFASGKRGFSAGVLLCLDGSITDGAFNAESDGTAVGLLLNKCTISGGEFWAVSRAGCSIGIGEALKPLDGGTVTAWAETKDKATGVRSPQLSHGKEELRYAFVYDGKGYIGDTTLYSVNNALVREIYNTENGIIFSPRPDYGAIIIPNQDKILAIDLHKSVPVSFDSRPGYDLESILINGEPIDIVKYIELITDKDYIVDATSALNQIHVDFEADIIRGIVPLHVTFTATAENEDGDVSWLWDFGNNERGYEPVADTTYTMPGTYSVLVTGTDNSASATARKTAYIIVEEAF
ncbi:MAG: PKD domain-containing protein [Methanomicrobiales archaeon]|jgi:hypothetical protein|nr:PKD domain-containing protein [Methanomicrobiales archaeon]